MTSKSNSHPKAQKGSNPKKGAKGARKGTEAPTGPPTARAVAWQALQRIESGGAYANLVLSRILEESGLPDRDRAYVTNLVYGTTRMRRACDHLIEPFLLREIDAPVRSLLRMGAFQLHFLETPSHAAVSETVAVAPRKVAGFVNAILRRVSEHTPQWPDPLTELSYPDWIGAQLEADWGHDQAVAALAHMNTPASVAERTDGYTQDIASQWVVDAVQAESGMVIADLCAAPGGKATGLAATGAVVIAADRRAKRAGLITANVERLNGGGESREDGGPVAVVVADGVAPPLRPQSFDRVLVDAPCSGLGVLRRRADARWTVDADAPQRLAALQRSILDSAAELVKPGGRLVYSVCTLTSQETIDVADVDLPGLRPVVAGTLPTADRWRPHGAGLALLPQDHDTDGMCLFVWERA